MLCMVETVKIGILGGDMRQTALARRLSEMGFETATWGLPAESDLGGSLRRLARRCIGQSGGDPAASGVRRRRAGQRAVCGRL